MDSEKSLAERREAMVQAVLPAVYGALASAAVVNIKGHQPLPEPHVFIREVVASTMHIAQAMLAALDQAKAEDRK